jgi:AcrR family transcriptional regulator
MEAAASRRETATSALLDAAERLLIADGYAGLTTRKVAAEAGVNHGLVHYYFGSMEELLLQVLERFTERLIERQSAMYAADLPFLEKWRTAMRWLDEDVEAGYPKVWW